MTWIIVTIFVFIVGLGLGSAMSAGKQDVKIQLTKLKQVDDELLSRQNDAVFLAGTAFKHFAKGDFSELDVIEGESTIISRDVEQLTKKRQEVVKELGL